MGANISRKGFGIWLAGVAAAFLLGLRPETANAQPCMNPNDCAAMNGPCSVGVCDQNQCQRNPINEGQSCAAPNICITGATCNNGFCVGTYTPNCCTTPTDCNDHNPCTIDSCQGNVCQHANAAPGSPCGSNVDDACTTSDTCNSAGQCQANDTPNGADCGGPDCLGGQCGATNYRAHLLPEGSNLGSEPRGAALVDGDPDRPIIVGRVVDAGSVVHAAAWKCNAGGLVCTLTELPEGGAGTSVANGIACNASACLAVGSVGSPPQPRAWFYNGSTWAGEAPPLPMGATAGLVVVDSTQAQSNKVFLVGVATTAGEQKAVHWERDQQGVYGVFGLPDFGVPGRGGAATDIDSCPTGAPAQLCVPGARIIAGWAEDGPGIARPVVWRESGLGSGNFAMSALPLPAGALAVMTVYNPFRNQNIWWLQPSGGGYIAGTITMIDGTTRAVVWRTTDFQNWTSAVLPPLPGHSSSWIEGSGDPAVDVPNLQFAVSGSSYPTGGDPSLDGVATQWTLDADTLALTTGPTNASIYLPDFEPERIVYRFFNQAELESATFEIVDHALLAVSDALGSPAAGATQPHAAIAIAVGPAGIPTVSTWGMAVMSLLVLAAATIVIRRMPRRICDPFRVG